MMRSSFSGIAVMAMLSPDGAGPMRVPRRSRTPAPVGWSSNHQLDVGFSMSLTHHPKALIGSRRFTIEVVSHSPNASCRLRPTNRAPTSRSSSSQSAPRNSFENRAGTLMSTTSAQTASIDASMSSSTSAVGPSWYLDGALATHPGYLPRLHVTRGERFARHSLQVH